MVVKESFFESGKFIREELDVADISVLLSVYREISFG
jgi:hypothetical protein